MLLIERSKWWRCYCWSNSQSAEDVAEQKVQVLKMSLLIERSKCWRCCGSKTEDVVDDEDYMMLKRFQWFIDVLPFWCWCWSKGQSVDDDVADRKIRIWWWWWWCCSKSQNAEDVVADRKVKVLKIVADRSDQSVDVTEDGRLKMKTTWCWKASNDL